MSRAINGYLNKNMQKKLFITILLATLTSTSLPLNAFALNITSPGTGSNQNTEQNQSTDEGNAAFYVTPSATDNSASLGSNNFDTAGSINYNDSSFGSTRYSGVDNLSQSLGSTDLSGLPQASAGSQAAGGTNGKGGGGTVGGASSAAGNVGSCAISGAIAHAVSSAVSSMTSNLFSGSGGSSGGSSSGGSGGGSGGMNNPVPTKNDNQDPKVAAATAAHTGNITIGGMDLGISWDGLAYCAGNAVIQYVGDQMMNMINKGFNGNPAFIKNPQQFFSDISAGQANQFIKTLTNSSIAPPLQGTIAKNLIGGYNSNFTGSQPNKWSNSQTQAYNSFTSGSPNGFSLSSLFNISQNPSNNFYGSQMMAQNQLQAQIAQKVGLQQQQLQWNNGYMSTQQCQTVNGKQVCNVTTPGTNIAQAGKDAQNLPNLRLAAQNKFDQVLSMLIQQLIKTGLSELMKPSTGGSSSSGSSGGGSSGSNPNPKGVPSGYNYWGQVGSPTSTVEFFSNKNGTKGYIFDESTNSGFSTTSPVTYYDPSTGQAFNSVGSNKTASSTAQ